MPGRVPPVGDALQALEFVRALRCAARFAATAPGREAVMSLRPAADPEEVRARLAGVEAARAFLAEKSPWEMPPLPDCRAALQRAGVDGAVLSAGQLARLGVLLASAGSLARDLAGAEALRTLAVRLAPAPELEAAIGRAVDGQGAVRDEASRELARLRRQLGGAHNRVVAHLESLLERVDGRHRVPDASVSIREGRYVIPLRREGMRAVGGCVHDESASGATVFVEPPSAIGLMNRVRGLERAEKREVHRILRSLTRRCRPLAGELAESWRALAEMDRLVALARAADDWRAACPRVGGGPLAIRGGRHPLLLAAGADAVPFDFELDDGERVVVVTGPNTGGKTVLLKSVGLIAAMAQAGIVPPVGPGTRLPVFDSFFADVGDQQSIADSLSTFSGHLRNLRRVLLHAGPRSLALIDEPGAGTDPAEGEALALALVETLAARGCTAVVTSHLGGLKRLATAAGPVVNASLHFDGERLAPTYRFAKGRPGRSYGLAIARGLGFPEDVIDRAERHRDRREARVDELLADLEQKEARASRLVAELEADKQRAARLGAELDARAERLRLAEEAHAREARREARRLLLGARREVEAAIARLADRVRSEAGLEEAAGQARRAVEAAARRLEEPVRAEGAAPGGEDGAGPSASGGRLRPGSEVLLPGLGARGTVVAVEGGRLVVSVGSVRMKVDEAEAVAAEGGEEARRQRGGDGGEPRPSSGPRWNGAVSDPAPSLDLRGQRADEAELSLLRALDDAVAGGLRELRVVHGKGGGVLRQRVAAVLQGDGRVDAFRTGGPGEGGYGVTVARIAG